MQCECCLESCYAKDMAELSCHHIAHKVCIDILKADPLYARRQCPVKPHCDGVNLILGGKKNETKEQTVERLRKRVEEIKSYSIYSADSETIETYAARLAFERLHAQLGKDEHFISCKDNKLRYLKWTNVDRIMTVTVYMDKVVQYSLKFGQPYCEVIPNTCSSIGADFIVSDNDSTCLLVSNGIIYPYDGHYDREINFSDFDNKVDVTIYEDNYEDYRGEIEDHCDKSNGKARMLLEAEQLLSDQHYSQWLNKYQYELKNLKCTIDRLNYF